MFKKILASVGIGAAKVDTRLFNDSVFPGDLLEGEVFIKGGDISQNIDDIYLDLVTQYKREKEEEGESSSFYEEWVMLHYQLMERFTIEPKEEIAVPFAVELPLEMPLTLGRTPVYIRTGLDIKTAIDPKDRDEIEVKPHPLMERVFQAVENLGFRLHEVDCEYAESWRGKYPFVQEFEFKPNGKYRKYLDELEIIFNLYSDKLEVLLEIDKKARGFGGWFQEAFDLDERYARFYLTESNLDVEVMIEDAIQNSLD